MKQFLPALISFQIWKRLKGKVSRKFLDFFIDTMLSVISSLFIFTAKYFTLFVYRFAYDSNLIGQFFDVIFFIGLLATRLEI